MSAASSQPHLAPDCDVRKLPLSPTEAFVLSRIDGASTPTDLSNATGLPEGMILQALDRLAGLGAIVYPGARGTASGVARAQSSPDGGDVSGVRATAPPASMPRPVHYDSSLLDEEVDIPLEVRKDLLDLFFSIELVTHYQLLGVSQAADRKAIKQAYFERVNVLHPDRFFGKSIGSYKGRIERVFTALTKAHDTLTKRQSRADYDSYLESRKETVGLRSSRAPTPPSRPPGEADPAMPPPARTPLLAQEMLGSVEMREAERPRASVPPTAADSGDARRQMARKLKSASIPPPSAATEDQTENNRRALDADLRARYEARLKDPAATNRFMALAADAERSGSWASAVNALKAALDLEPDNPKVREELARVEVLSDKAYAGRYVEQARYEERDGQFERAARSYERAARGRGSAELYAHAALCQLRVDSGGRRAVELARRAVTLSPAHVGSRLALARAYFQEGMSASAIAELARALEVDPKNDEAKRLQAEFKKSG